MILAFDTSAAHCAAALLSGERIVAEAHEEMTRGQGERLIGLLEEVLAAGGATWPDLDRIGVGTGPGNFTGIRIAVSAARGLALGLERPAIGVSNFEITHAALARPGERRHLVVLPARAGSFIQEFSDGRPTGAPALWTAGATLPALADPAGTVVIGDGGDLVAQALCEQLAPPAQVRPGSVAPSQVAPRIATMAARRDPRDCPRPTPLYARAPDAAPSRHAAPRLLS